MENGEHRLKQLKCPKCGCDLTEDLKSRSPVIVNYEQVIMNTETRCIHLDNAECTGNLAFACISRFASEKCPTYSPEQLARMKQGLKPYE